MFQKDYIKRSFSFIQATLARLRGVVEVGDAEVAREEITDAYSRVFGIPLSLLSLSPAGDIADLLSTSEGENAGRILSLAELLKMDGELYQKEGDAGEAQWRRAARTPPPR